MSLGLGPHRVTLKQPAALGLSELRAELLLHPTELFRSGAAEAGPHGLTHEGQAALSSLAQGVTPRR